MGTNQPTRSTQSLYDETAHRWVRDDRQSLSDFTGRPPTLELCGEVAGLRVLDLGCGEGYCARQLRRAGAGEVTGIDISGGMIEAARQQEARESLGISYDQGEATDLSRFPDGHFDLVLAMFLFNYLDVAATAATMKEVRRLVRPGGRFVFAVPHPSFAFLRRPAPPFYFQTEGAAYFSARDRRFPGRIYRRDGTPLDVQMFHKTLEDYFSGLSAAGFERMPQVRELRVTPELLTLDPAFFSPVADVPLHLAIAVSV